jgi:hypothetical protein
MLWSSARMMSAVAAQPAIHRHHDLEVGPVPIGECRFIADDVSMDRCVPSVVSGIAR